MRRSLSSDGFRRAAVAVLLLAAPVVATTGARAQTIGGTVVDLTDGTAVPSARIAVLDTTGTEVAWTRSDGEGSFVLRDVPPGPLAVRVEAFGYAASAERRLEYDGGPLTLEVGVEPAPVEAGGIHVRVQARASRLRESVQMLSGRVLDHHTGDPVDAADVIARDVRDEPAGRALTDEDGRFWIRLDGAGLYRLSVSRFGYDSTATANIGAAPGQDLYVELRVQPRAFGVEPITVTAPRVLPYLEASGFYSRKKRGHGDFIGPRDIERYPGAFPTHLLRRIPGVSVTRGHVRMRGVSSLSGTACAPLIVLDWMEMRGGESLDDLVPLSHIEGIEVYKGAATVPPQWRGYATCGVIVVWTKH